MKRDYAEYLINKTKSDYNLISGEFSITRKEAWQETDFLFNNYLTKGDKVLDLGCGNGRYYELFKNKEIDYIGVDSSEKLVNIAKEKYPAVKFQAEDALNLPFPDNHFDKIYSIAVLHHIPSKELRMEFLKESKRVLKKDGILILTVWKFHQLKEICSLIKYSILKLIGKSKLDFKDILEPWGKKTDRYYHWFSKKELIILAKKSGFKIEKAGIIKNKKGNRENIYLVVEK